MPRPAAGQPVPAPALTAPGLHPWHGRTAGGGKGFVAAVRLTLVIRFGCAVQPSLRPGLCGAGLRALAGRDDRILAGSFRSSGSAPGRRPGWVMRRSPARDAEELAACFTAHARELFGYACVLARGDRALAEDLVQAAFEAAAGRGGRCGAWPRTSAAAGCAQPWPTSRSAASGARRRSATGCRGSRPGTARLRRTPRRRPFPRSRCSGAGRSSRACRKGSTRWRCCAGSRT